MRNCSVGLIYEKIFKKQNFTIYFLHNSNLIGHPELNALLYSVNVINSIKFSPTHGQNELHRARILQARWPAPSIHARPGLLEGLSQVLPSASLPLLHPLQGR